MLQTFWRVVNRRTYCRGMEQRRKPPRVAPERKPAGLDSWAGLWVAVKDGEVIAAAQTSRELVPRVREKGEAGHGAVARFVPQASRDIVIGVG